MFAPRMIEADGNDRPCLMEGGSSEPPREPFTFIIPTRGPRTMDADTYPARGQPHRLDREQYRQQWRAVGFTLCATQGRSLVSLRGAPATIKNNLRAAARDNGCAVIAYCIMPNHLHLLACVVTEGGDLLDFMDHFKRRSGFELGRLGEPGPVWQRDFWDRHMRSDEHLDEAVAYIMDNPVRAGLCEHADDWRHSEFCGFPR